MQAEDRVRLLHMIEAMEAALGFVAGRQRADLDSDPMLLFALVRAIEVVGEAATKVSEEFRSKAPDIPWGPIVSMRNRLIHAYFDIDRDILWKTAIDELPTLLPRLQALIKSEG
ncbi:MAG: DUF86 domain-containing protein [Acidobacteria bacterium]|nr:DUF86 domain-containing protein [Acidobacteriota bacterium]MCI0717989.1 DUF86 domain-containing protein [Acidobacteriota bacterium]